MVILLNDIPEQIDWYRGKQLVGLKITTIDPWTTIRSIKKNANALTNFYGSKENVPPVLVILQMVDLNTAACFLAWN